MKTRTWIASCCLIGVGLVASAQTAPVRVTGWGQHYGGQVTYRYEVQNLGSQPITRIVVGLPLAGSGAELTARSRFKPRTFWAVNDAFTAPQGWGAAYSPEDETDKWTLEWVEAAYLRQSAPGEAAMPEAPAVVAGATGVLPGTTVNAFSIAVPSVDAAYVSGRAAITMGNSDVAVPVTRGDATPPVVSLDVSRLNQNGGEGTWAMFKVVVSATDNYDPQPELVFLPIVADQTASAGDIVVDKNTNRAWNVRVKNVAGRTYTFTAKATDASGNVGTAIYRYTVSQ